MHDFIISIMEGLKFFQKFLGKLGVRIVNIGCISLPLSERGLKHPRYTKCIYLSRTLVCIGPWGAVVFKALRY
jgi:hypothetical protein